MHRKSAQVKKKTKVRSRNKKKLPNKKFKKALSVIIVFLISTIFLSILTIYNFVNQHTASALSASSYSVLEDPLPTASYVTVKDFSKDPIEVVSIEYLIFDKSTNKVMIYNLPLSFKVDVPGKYGVEEISKIFALGGLDSEDKLKNGVELINASLFKIFAFKVDKFVIVEESFKEKADNFLYKGDLFSFINKNTISSLPTLVRTNFNISELNSMQKFVKSLPEERFIKVPLGYEEELNMGSFDEDIQDMTLGSVLAMEKKSIAVLNGSKVEGLAGFGSRVVKNSGGRVIAINNTEAVYNESVLISDDPTSETTNYLSRVFNINNVINKEEATNRFNEKELDRADVVIILGFDSGESL